MKTQILIADPQPTRCEDLSIIVKSAGFQPRSIIDFPPQHEMVEQFDPQVLLIPDSPGVEMAIGFCRSSKGNKPNLPIVVYSSDISETLRLRFLENGADEVMNKDDVPRAVRQILINSNARPQQAEKEDSSTLEKAKGDTQELRQQIYLKLGPGELGNAIQFLTMSPRSGEIELTFPHDDDKGHIFLENGQAVHLEYQGLTGTEAFALMLTEEEAEAQFYDGRTPVEKTISTTCDHLLIEASVMGDEFSALRKLVSPESRPVIKNPDANLKDNPDAPVIMPFMDGGREVKDIAQMGGISVVKTCICIGKLVQAGDAELVEE